LGPYGMCRAPPTRSLACRDIEYRPPRSWYDCASVDPRVMDDRSDASDCDDPMPVSPVSGRVLATSSQIMKLCFSRRVCFVFDGCMRDTRYRGMFGMTGAAVSCGGRGRGRGGGEGAAGKKRDKAGQVSKTASAATETMEFPVLAPAGLRGAGFRKLDRGRVACPGSVVLRGHVGRCEGAVPPRFCVSARRPRREGGWASAAPREAMSWTSWPRSDWPVAPARQRSA
jgi:hypothetical protein